MAGESAAAVGPLSGGASLLAMGRASRPPRRLLTRLAISALMPNAQARKIDDCSGCSGLLHLSPADAQGVPIRGGRRRYCTSRQLPRPTCENRACRTAKPNCWKAAVPVIVPARTASGDSLRQKARSVGIGKPNDSATQAQSSAFRTLLR
jgi:hypothetical protein